MRQLGKFIKGCLYGILLLTVIQSPFAEEVKGIEKENKGGILTTHATILPLAVSPLVEYVSAREVLPPSEKSTPTPTPAKPDEKKSEVLALSSVKAKKIEDVRPNVIQPTPTQKLIEPTQIPIQQSSTVSTIGIPYEEHFNRYSEVYGVDKGVLVKIARCESGFRYDAVNGPYLGMYQYLASTWSSTRNAMGENPDPSLRTSPEEAIKTSAWKIAHGGIGAWPVCGKS